MFFCLISKFPCFPRFLAEPWPWNNGLGCGLDDPGFQSRQGQGGFLFSKASRPSMGPTQPPVQWIQGVFPGVKRPGRQVDHSYSSEVTSAAVPLLLRGEDRNRCTFCNHEYLWRCGFVAVHALVVVRGQPYTPAGLVPGKGNLVPIEQEAKRIPEPVRTLWKSETPILSRYLKGKTVRSLKIPVKYFFFTHSACVNGKWLSTRRDILVQCTCFVHKHVNA